MCFLLQEMKRAAGSDIKQGRSSHAPNVMEELPDWQ